MAAIKIYCPNCGRIIGDTEKSIECNFNCRGCKTTQHIKMEVLSVVELYNLSQKEEKEE